MNRPLDILRAAPVALVCGAGLMCTGVAGAKPAQPPAQPPVQAPGSPAPASPAPAPIPSLDDLLKLTPPAPGKPGDRATEKGTKPAAPKPTDLTKPAEKPAEKDESSPAGRDGQSSRAQANPLTEAVDLMLDASGRLSTAGDTSIQTQRIQQSAIDKLDALISQAKKKQQKKKQQSKQQKQDQQDPSSQKQEQQQSQGQQQKPQQQPGRMDSADRTDADLPAGQGAALSPALEAARASWGNLPARIRDLLTQGSGEKFSGMYQQMTEDYYRKLGEKPEEKR